MANILIPIAGLASRFIKNNILAPKPLIMVKDKMMIDWAMESIIWDKSDTLIFIVRHDHITQHAIDKILKQKFGHDIKIVVTDKITKGTLCTCLLAKDLIDNSEPLLIYTPDVTFSPAFNIRYGETHNIDGLLLTFKANSPAHSYVQLDDNGHAIHTAEKEVISQDACVGVYWFKHGSQFVIAAETAIENNETINGEFYVCPIYNELIEWGLKIKALRTDKMHVLGTPEDVDFFVKRVLRKMTDKPVAICADHSGFALKEMAKDTLAGQGIKFIDFGTYVQSDCDHHDYLSAAIRSIQNGICDFGFAFCSTGQGFNIAANKAVNIRSALIWDDFTAEHSIAHNAANFFCVPASYVDTYDFELMINKLNNTSFDGGRHTTRIRKFEQDEGMFGV